MPLQSLYKQHYGSERRAGKTEDEGSIPSSPASKQIGRILAKKGRLRGRFFLLDFICAFR